MKWFSINGIITEAKRIRWPKMKDLAKDSTTVIVFTLLMGIFFFVCQIISSGFLSMIGM